MKKDKNKLFITRKYVRALSVSDALKKEKKQAVDDCWVDDEWKKANENQLASSIGFDVPKEE